MTVESGTSPTMQGAHATYNILIIKAFFFIERAVFGPFLAAFGFPVKSIVRVPWTGTHHFEAANVEDASIRSKR